MNTHRKLFTDTAASGLYDKSEKNAVRSQADAVL